MPKKDYYETLGVDRDSSEEGIKRAFRHLARKHHPDVNPGDKGAEERFKKINEAFEVLKDPEKRAAYDQFGEAGLEGAGFRPHGAGEFPGFDELFRDFGFGDIFDVFSGLGGRARARRGAIQGADLKYELDITLENSFEGITTKIEVPRHERCPDCRGTGAMPGTSPKTCPECGGAGEVRTIKRMGFMHALNIGPCGRCRGTGTVIDRPCKNCSGTGLKKVTRKVEVNVPAGVDDGQYLRLAGQGEAGSNGGPPGDLYVVITLREHPVFERHDTELFCKTTIGIATAITGGSIEVPTITSTAKLKIPPGTQSHTVFRLRGQGMPELRGRGRGDQLVKVVVKIPSKASREQIGSLKELDDAGSESPSTDKGFFERLREHRK